MMSKTQVEQDADRILQMLWGPVFEKFEAVKRELDGGERRKVERTHKTITGAYVD